MSLGILKDHSDLSNVPGTTCLAEKLQSLEEKSTTATTNLKHGSGSASHIVLAPQPSDDPNDPLNFSESRKLTIVTVIVFGSCPCAATIGPLMNADLVVFATYFKTDIAKIT